MASGRHLESVSETLLVRAKESEIGRFGDVAFVVAVDVGRICFGDKIESCLKRALGREVAV